MPTFPRRYSGVSCGAERMNFLASLPSPHLPLPNWSIWRTNFHGNIALHNRESVVRFEA